MRITYAFRILLYKTICRFIHITFHQFIKICNILKFAGSCVVVTILQIVYTLYISLKTRNILCHQIVFILHLHVYRTVSSIICCKKWIWILWKKMVEINCPKELFGNGTYISILNWSSSGPVFSEKKDMCSIL